MARKPTSPPSALVFPTSEAPYVEADELPATTEEIEAYVVALFAVHLKQSGRQVDVLPRPEGDWPDAALVLDGRRVGVELVEVVDRRHRQMLQGRPWYLSESRRLADESGLSSALEASR